MARLFLAISRSLPLHLTKSPTLEHVRKSQLWPLCSSSYSTSHNPLLEDFEFPPSDRIQPCHVPPGVAALLNKLENELAELESSVDASCPKLVEPLEKITDRLQVVWGVVNHLKAVKDTPQLRSAIEQVQPEKVKFELKLGQSKPIYNAFKAIRESSDWDALSDARKRIVEFAGESLKAIFSSGLREEMDRALALLAKQSVASKTTSKGSSARVGEGVPKLITVPDVDVVAGTETENVVSGGVGDSELRERKLNRDRDGGSSRRIVLRRCEDGGRDIVGKVPTVPEAANLPPILQPVDSLSAVRVEVSPNQRWTAGPNAPVQVFQVFDLPQDLTSYVDKSRAEIAERCLMRGGRFLADLTHIVNSYKSDANSSGKERFAKELSDAKAGRSEAEKRAAESERRETEAAKVNFEAKKKLMEENDCLKGRISSLNEEINQAKVVVNTEKGKSASLEGEVKRVCGELTKLREENAALKLEVDKGVADVAKALGVGYGYCYDRLNASGVDLVGHSFDDYCADLAKTMQNSVAEEENLNPS